MTEIDLVEALQRAMAQAGSEWTAQPSRLRRRLDEVLGSDARRLRSQVHLVVVAAEEKVPVRLKRNGWSPVERDELTVALSDARGWTRHAAEWSVVTWAAALGLTDERPAPLVPVSRASVAMPDEAIVTDFPTDLPASVPAAEPVPVADPQGTILPVAEPTPLVSGDQGTILPVASGEPEGTVLPNGTVLPEGTVLPVEGTVLPTPGPDLAAMPPPTTAPLPAPVARVPVAGAVPTAELPTKHSKGLVIRAAECLGHDVDVAYEVRTGINPAILLGVALVFGIAGVMTTPSGPRIACFVVFTLAMISVRWTSKVLALRGDDVWLMDNSWFSSKLQPPMITATRDEIEAAGGSPFGSVRLRGTRLWFFVNSGGVSKVLPTHAPVEVAP